MKNGEYHYHPIPDLEQVRGTVLTSLQRHLDTMASIEARIVPIVSCLIGTHTCLMILKSLFHGQKLNSVLEDSLVATDNLSLAVSPRKDQLLHEQVALLNKAAASCYHCLATVHSVFEVRDARIKKFADALAYQFAKLREEIASVSEDIASIEAANERRTKQ